MSDPTPTPTAPAVTARSAREVIREALDASEKCHGSQLYMEGAWGVPEWQRRARAFVALRALLDAPTSAVEGLVSAVAEVVRLERDRGIGIELIVDDQRYDPETRARAKAFLAMESALAAVRASPEAVGAGCAWAASGLGCPCVKERDALKADLAHAERQKAMALQAEQDIRVLKGRAEADLAAARGEAERLRGANAMLAANASAARLNADARTGAFSSVPPQSVMADLAVVYGTPPPASEAATLPPLSDRVKWIAQYVKEHVRLDETSAENLAREGAKILRICEKHAKETK